MSYIGLVQSTWDKLSQDLPTGEALIGQKIPLNKNRVSIFLAVDKSDHVHFLISPAPSKINRLAKLNLKDIIFDIKNWVISDLPQQKYLDIECAANSKSALRRPFAKFCEDLLSELEISQNLPEDSIYKICRRWQQFWTTELDSPFTPEWARGLLGELHILEKLFKVTTTDILASWVGPDGKDHDFQSFGIGIEVKTTISVPPKITVNSIRQFDEKLFDKLYVASLQLTESERGESLVDYVRKIEGHIVEDSENMDIFWGKLGRAGYARHLEKMYSDFKYTVHKEDWYIVDSNFPKIVASSFVQPLHNKILKVQYNVELTGLKSLDFNSTVLPSLKTLAGGR